MPIRRRWSAGLTIALLTGTAGVQAQVKVEVSINAAAKHQTWWGFGATHQTLVYGGTGDVLSASQRQRAVRALFSEVGLSTGQIPTIFEAPKSSTLENFFSAQTNDNADPMTLDPNGIFTGAGDAFKKNVVDVAGGPQDLYADVKISTKYGSKWLGEMLAPEYQQYLDEAAEQALAGVDYFKKTYGAAPAYAMLFNEPTTGNGELPGATTETIVDLVARAGARLAAAGYGDVGLVVPAEETEERSLEVATAIMNDAQASKYVGAIAYHPYPYGSAYSYVPNILDASGKGTPNAGRIQVRKQLHELAVKHGVALWMTEVSHAYDVGDNVVADDFRVARGRAIHIHDELEYAEVSAFFGMNSIWDTKSQAGHFGTDGSEMMTAEHDTIVLVEQAKDAVTISGMGRAIGHYARFIKRGAVRVEATSDNPLVQVSAFLSADRLTLVAINNASTEASLHVSVQDGSVASSLGGEQSTKDAYWKKLADFDATAEDEFSLSVPAESITSVTGSAELPPGAGGATPGGGGSSNSSGGNGPSAGAASSPGGDSTGASSPGSAGKSNPSDASSEGGAGDAPGGAASGDDGGCGCRVPSGPASPALPIAAGLALTFALARRKASRGQTR